MEDRQVRIGGFWPRVAAGAVDAVILAIPVGLVAGGGIARGQVPTPGVLVLAAALAMFYRVLFEGSPLQATPGKLLLGLRVANLSGGRISFATAALRSWPWWLTGAIAGMAPAAIPVAVVLSLASVLSVALGADRRGLHDRMSGTRVLRHDGAAARPVDD